jgi:hypothetical protein
MGFWTTFGYKYTDFIDLPLEKLVLLINAMNRNDLIEWLAWNDPNGIYHDTQSLKELGNTLSKEEGIEIMLRQIEENRVPAK